MYFSRLCRTHARPVLAVLGLLAAIGLPADTLSQDDLWQLDQALPVSNGLAQGSSVDTSMAEPTELDNLALRSHQLMAAAGFATEGYAPGSNCNFGAPCHSISNCKAGCVACTPDLFGGKTCT